VGQEEAIEAVSDAVRRMRGTAGHEENLWEHFFSLEQQELEKPELAKALAGYLFDDENAMTRIDMSEYQERHSKQIGGTPQDMWVMKKVDNLLKPFVENRIL
jgi:ATP-dependent Clp protease ATP-binding subunit ClpB